ncbi:head GIN domain-containing protein [Christiangramia echinicola]|uniref:Auto-transporter adhesin, head GIN domain n=1 Tax=Christiangramia echinicola TaxID=279359 RepID=A0A1H1LIH6_9FLAO|nr:head GIN domain-containing protein [Christiangramia echinicola]SDR74316.1 Putative auto-transporter adhesin, head GIN domain [Christiangramia echinicola]
MRKIIYLLAIIGLVGCDSEEAGNCLQKSGDIIQEEILVENFDEIIVYDKIKLYIEQGDQQKVLVETGENLLNEISVEVEAGRLVLKNENRCNFFREYGVTSVYVTIPDLKYLRHAGNIQLESIGTLNFEELWLVSENQALDPEIHTDGNFKLDLNVKNLRITNDNYSHFFLTGSVENFDGFFAAGDGRLEARDLIVQNYDLFHRGTNKLIVNPQQSLKGDIFSYGDIISVNRPPEVDVEEHFRGKLIFEEN